MSNRTKLRARAGRPVRASTPTGTRRWHLITVPLLAFAVGALLGGPIGAAIADPRTDYQKRVGELQAAEIQRDKDQVVSLTAQARRLRDELAPVLEGLDKTIPVGGSTVGPVATQTEIDSWKAITKKLTDEFDSPPSAGTAVNIARSSLATAVRQLDLAVGVYAEAAEAARPELLALAARQRDNAVTTWSVGATQLDVLNIDTGHGHQHVFLPSSPGQGAMTSDGSREGK
jgi:hypothetical protein